MLFVTLNADLPVLFAFESGFELLIGIMDSEGWLEGGVVIQDCLRLMVLVLENNTNTQSFFREMGFMHKLLPLFQNNSGWDNRRAMIASTALGTRRKINPNLTMIWGPTFGHFVVNLIICSRVRTAHQLYKDSTQDSSINPGLKKSILRLSAAKIKLCG